MKSFYAAKFNNGEIKTYRSWRECSMDVTGAKGVLYKGFETEESMHKWIGLETTSHVDTDSGVRAYVDGSYSKNRGTASWAYVIVKDNEIIKYDSGKVPHAPMSNNIDGECYAAMYAIHWLHENNIEAYLVHDYMGLSAWLTGEYKAESQIAQMYVRNCSGKIANIKFVKVKGHTGNYWNEHVDKLARDANE